MADRARSTALLIGTSTYRSAEINNLPSVRNNLADLKALVTEPRLGAIAPQRCRVILDPADPRTVWRSLREAALGAEDTLVVYFAGHGMTGAGNELYLGLADTDPDALAVSAMRFDLVREVLTESPATNKVVILDCCFSGWAIQGMSGQRDGTLGQVAISGTYVLAAAPATRQALAPTGARHTAFTGELISLLRDGVSGGPELLTFATIYSRLLQVTTHKGLPRPGQRGTGTAELLALRRNPARVTERPSGGAQTRPAPQTRPVAQTAPPAPTAPARPAAPTKTTPANASGIVTPLPDYESTPRIPRIGFNREGTLLATCHSDLTLRLWDPATGTQTSTLRGHSAPVARVNFHPDGRRLLTASTDSSIRVWDLTTKRATRTFSNLHVAAMAISPDGQAFAIAGKGKSIRLWNMDTGRLVRGIAGHSQTVVRLAFSPDGLTLLSTSVDRTMRVWDLKKGEQVSVIPGVLSPYLCGFHFPTDRAIVGTKSGQIRLHELSTGRLIRTLDGHDRAIQRMATSYTAQVLATVGDDGVLRTWDLGRAAPIRTYDCGVGNTSHLAFSPDGQFLAVTGRDKVIRVFRTDSNKLVHALQSDLFVHWFSFGDGGRLLAAASPKDRVQVWTLDKKVTHRVLTQAPPKAKAPGPPPQPKATASAPKRAAPQQAATKPAAKAPKKMPSLPRNTPAVVPPPVAVEPALRSMFGDLLRSWTRRPDK